MKVVNILATLKSGVQPKIDLAYLMLHAENLDEYADAVAALRGLLAEDDDALQEALALRLPEKRTVPSVKELVARGAVARITAKAPIGRLARGAGR